MSTLIAILLATPLVQQASEHRSMLEGHRVYEWPFSGMLKSDLCEEGKDSVLIFSYGSLLNERSAARTLSPESLRSREPAIAFGLRRVFDRNVPEDLFAPRYGPPKQEDERAALNAYPTGRMKDMVNGVLVEVEWEDLTALCNREVGYDLIPVLVTSWDNPGKFRVAHTFSAPKGRWAMGHQLVRKDIRPIPGYAKVVEEGAASYGPKFLKFYRETTENQ
jgi:hypothetical protein